MSDENRPSMSSQRVQSKQVAEKAWEKQLEEKVQTLPRIFMKLQIFFLVQRRPHPPTHHPTATSEYPTESLDPLRSSVFSQKWPPLPRRSPPRPPSRATHSSRSSDQPPRRDLPSPPRAPVRECTMTPPPPCTRALCVRVCHRLVRGERRFFWSESALHATPPPSSATFRGAEERYLCSGRRYF
jgi:hypothetical protein